MVETSEPTTLLAERVVGLFRQAMRLQRRASPEDWVALELTMAQMKVLHVLQHRGTARISDLAEIFGISPPSMTGTLERMVRQGLVERGPEPSDRRVVIIRLTAEGQALVDRLLQGRHNRMMAALARLEEPAVEQLASSLAELVAALETVQKEAQAAETLAGGGDRPVVAGPERRA